MPVLSRKRFPAPGTLKKIFFRPNLQTKVRVTEPKAVSIFYIRE